MKKRIKKIKLALTAEEDKDLIETLRKTIRAMRMVGETANIVKPKKV